jgi:hypothetical protein
MNLAYWTCKCKRHHTQGISRCRKCGDLRSNYGADGESITAKREKRTDPAKRANTAKLRKYDDAGDREAAGDTIFQSTLHTNTEETK